MLKQFILSAIIVGGFAGSASAMPAPARTVPGAALQDNIIDVSGGCGPYGYRGPYGGCRPISAPVARPCPPGFHLGAYRGRCWPNR